MILSDDGKYYLGEGTNVEITSNLINQIYNEISQNLNKEIKKIQKILYTLSIKLLNIYNK